MWFSNCTSKSNLNGHVCNNLKNISWNIAWKFLSVKENLLEFKLNANINLDIRVNKAISLFVFCAFFLVHLDPQNQSCHQQFCHHHCFWKSCSLIYLTTRHIVDYWKAHSVFLIKQRWYANQTCPNKTKWDICETAFRHLHNLFCILSLLTALPSVHLSAASVIIMTKCHHKQP